MSSGSRKTASNSIPATNPPTCAQTATPLATSGRRRISSGTPASNCQPNHQSSTIHAGIRKTRKKITKMKSIFTRARGYRSRYAPITPEIAPLAPTIGTGLAGWRTTCVSAAATPHSR